MFMPIGIDSTLTTRQRYSKRADRALNIHIPHINNELDESKEKLIELAERLPTIRTAVSDIRTVYDSGRSKVRSLTVFTCPAHSPHFRLKI